ncbi:MAG: hypothetical protein HC936_00540 [Leptolyngbyaceae cyanobacterium SU_3_3]|nr:hypothetical protein [Leptolyngbyaceae cyanobacterium SU_3_3]
MNYKPEEFHTVTANATYKDTKAAIKFYKRTLNLTLKIWSGATAMRPSMPPLDIARRLPVM